MAPKLYSERILGFCLFAVCLLPARGMHLKQCKGVDLDVAEAQMMNMKECLKDFGVTEIAKIPMEKAACFGKCVMVKRGAIDDKGLPHKENIMKMVTNDMPPIVHEELNKLMEVCLKDETSMIDPNDESCTTYLPLMMCMHTTFFEACV